MHKQPTPINRHFIVSGEGIEIRPLAGASMFEGYPPEGRFPTLLELEQEYVQRVLAHVEGNKSRAAQVLGIDRVSLWRKLKRLESLSSPSGAPPLQEYADRP
ncbi:MAG: helix-turn-helix domain-containing protein [Desulfurivibrionaceae bacterium]|jgi:DNA-binding NtrC family response regulator